MSLARAFPVAVAVAIALALGARAADADGRSKAEAQRHIDNATKLFANNQPAAALVELEAAIALDPRPELLYAIGQAHASLGECDEATKYFERYLATQPGPNPSTLAKQAIAACKDKPQADAADPSPRAAAPPPQPPPPERPIATVTRATTPAPWYADRVGDTLVAAGAIAAATAVVLYRDAGADIDNANLATTYPQRVSLDSSGHQDRTYAVIASAGAAVLLGAGVVRYVIHGRAETTGVAVAPVSGGGAAVLWSGGW